MRQFESHALFTDRAAEQQVLAAVHAEPALYWHLRDSLPAEAFAHCRQEWQLTARAIESENPLPSLPENATEPSTDPNATAEHLVRLGKRRRIALLHDRIAKGLYNEESDPGELANAISEEASSIATGFRDLDAGRVLWGAALLPEVLHTAEKRRRIREETGRPVVGLQTGLVNFDTKLNGFNQGLYILGGGPGAGKTAFAFQIAEHAASVENVPVVYVTFENSPANLIERRLAAAAGISASDIARGYADIGKLREASASLSRKLERVGIIEGTSRLTVADVRAQARQAMNRFGASRCLVVVDYVQLWAKASKELEGRRDVRERVEVMGSELREIAAVLSSPVIALSSLNRESGNYGRNGGNTDNGNVSPKGKAALDALKETGDLEYSADVVVLLNPRGGQVAPPARAMELTIAKNRHGDTGSIPVIFHADRYDFREVDRTREMF